MAKTRAQETAGLIKDYKWKRFLLVRDSITSTEVSPYRVSEVAEASVALAEHMADAPEK